MVTEKDFNKIAGSLLTMYRAVLENGGSPEEAMRIMQAWLGAGMAKVEAEIAQQD